MKFTAFFYAQFLESLHRQLHTMLRFYPIALLLILNWTATEAQMFTPSAGPLPDGDLNEPYVGQVIDFTVPQNGTISGEFVVQALSIVYPQTQPVLGFLNIDDQEFPIVVDRTTIIREGLPTGMNAPCDATPCTYIAGSTGYITLGGTPTEAGQFSIDMRTLTEGAVDISSITGGVLSSFGLPTSLGLPVPVPSSLSEEGYSLTVQNTSSIKDQNEVFELSLSPNPVSYLSTLQVNSKKSGTLVIEVYSAEGRLITTSSERLNIGMNRIGFDFSSLSNGIYLVKTNLMGHLALTRILKQ